ncbi:MAG: hypothetical protein NTW14_06900 [bacterium]|nr:hypothetical protein [bacterium]
MAAVHEGQINWRRKKTHSTDSHRSALHLCSNCHKETRWVSVDKLCWDCTVQAAKNKVPLFADTYTEDAEGGEGESETLASW